MEEVLKKIEQNKIIVIFRKIYGNDLLQAAKALYEGGVRLIEVTFDQADPQAIKQTTQAIQLLNDNFTDLIVGAGTVVRIDQLLAAKEAGAKYIISPNFDGEIVKKTKELGLISIPGCLTPTEVLSAHNAGADFVKLFPANSLGLTYLKDIRGPLNHIKLIATAGITEDNILDYLQAGCTGVGISGRLTDKKVIDAKNFSVLTERAKQFCLLLKEHEELNNNK